MVTMKMRMNGVAIRMLMTMHDGFLGTWADMKVMIFLFNINLLVRIVRSLAFVFIRRKKPTSPNTGYHYITFAWCTNGVVLKTF